jgi:hypothetical protein
MSQCGIRAKLCAVKISIDSSIQAQSTGEVIVFLTRYNYIRTIEQELL